MRTKGESGHVDTVVDVRYAETDAMGVVYYANYLVWMEVGRGAWCRARGFSYRDMETQDQLYLMVAEVVCRYKAPARYDDRILIRTAVAAASEKVIRFKYDIINESTALLLATGESVHVVTDAQYRPARLPDRHKKYFGLSHGKRV